MRIARNLYHDAITIAEHNRVVALNNADTALTGLFNSAELAYSSAVAIANYNQTVAFATADMDAWLASPWNSYLADWAVAQAHRSTRPTRHSSTPSRI